MSALSISFVIAGLLFAVLCLREFIRMRNGYLQPPVVYTRVMRGWYLEGMVCFAVCACLGLVVAGVGIYGLYR